MPLKNRILPDQATLRSLLNYNPETGVLTWRERPLSMFRPTGNYPAEWSWKKWNTRYAGKPAIIRATDGAGNARNSAMPFCNTSGHVGVHLNKRQGRWVAFIGSTHLGTFARLGDAVSARRAAERQLGYHENHGRRA